jgi:hypothetical protein
MSQDTPWAEIAPLLGHLLIEFNNVETATGSLICSILNQDRSIADVFSAVLSFSQKMALVNALIAAKYVPPDILTRIKKALTEARALNTTRNQVIHSEYSFESPDIDMPWHWWRKLRDGPKLELPVLVTASYSSIEISFLEKTVTDASNLATNIYSLSEDIREELKTAEARTP